MKKLDRRNLSHVAGDGERDAAQVRRIVRANHMDRCGTLRGDLLAVHGEKRPSAVQSYSAVGSHARFGDLDGVEGFNRMDANAREARGCRGHSDILARVAASRERVPEVPVNLACGGFRDEIKIFSMESVILKKSVADSKRLKNILRGDADFY